MTAILQELNILILPELADIIVSYLDEVDHTMLYFTSKKLNSITFSSLINEWGWESICNLAARNGYINIFKWLKEINRHHYYISTVYYAANAGQLKTLIWLKENGHHWNTTVMCCAAEKGHLETLKGLRNNGCPWDERTCGYAAVYGYIDVLKWARENGCPWDEQTRRRAAEIGYVEQ
jgi:hypothetical protein